LGETHDAFSNGTDPAPEEDREALHPAIAAIAANGMRVLKIRAAFTITPPRVCTISQSSQAFDKQ
jgi:hypothetical protein